MLLTVGQDEALDTAALTLFTTSGFTDVLGWDNTKIDQFRQAAIDWYLERFGIDFSQGTYDPSNGSVVTDFGIMIPIRYQGFEPHIRK